MTGCKSSKISGISFALAQGVRMKVSLAHGHHQLPAQPVQLKMTNNVKICTLVPFFHLLVWSVIIHRKMRKKCRQKQNKFLLLGSVDIGNPLIYQTLVFYRSQVTCLHKNQVDSNKRFVDTKEVGFDVYN